MTAKPFCKKGFGLQKTLKRVCIENRQLGDALFRGSSKQLPYDDDKPDLIEKLRI